MPRTEEATLVMAMHVALANPAVAYAALVPEAALQAKEALVAAAMHVAVGQLKATVPLEVRHVMLVMASVRKGMTLAALTAAAPATLMLKAARVRTIARTVAMASTVDAVLIAMALKRLLAPTLMLVELKARAALVTATERESPRAPP